MPTTQHAIEVNVPVQTVYSQLTRFAEYPRFMQDVAEVRQSDETHLHWHTRTEEGDLRWDAEITERVPDRSIAWRNTSGPMNRGRIELQPAGDGVTRVSLSIERDAQQAGDGEAALVQRTEQDLARFKKFVESQGAESGAAPAAHYGYSGPEAADATYAAGSEGWDGNEDPGMPVVSSARNVSDAVKETARVISAGQPYVPDGAQPEAPLSQSAGRRQEAGQPGVAEEPNRDRPSAAAARPEQSSSQQSDGATGAQSGRPEEQQPGPSWLPNFLNAWEEPLTVMRKVSDEMEQLFERFVGRPSLATRSRKTGVTSSGAWSPSLEIDQREGKMIVCAELPGVKREDVHVEIKNDHLIIEGDRRQETERQESGYRHTERSYGHFYRAISLPAGVDADAASASMRDGLLEVTIPLPRGGQQGKRLDISSPQ